MLLFFNNENNHPPVIYLEQVDGCFLGNNYKKS